MEGWILFSEKQGHLKKSSYAVKRLFEEGEKSGLYILLIVSTSQLLGKIGKVFCSMESLWLFQISFFLVWDQWQHTSTCRY